MSKSIKATDFQFGYQYEQHKRAQRKEQRNVRQLRQTKHSRFDWVDSEQ